VSDEGKYAVAALERSADPLFPKAHLEKPPK